MTADNLKEQLFIQAANQGLNVIDCSDETHLPETGIVFFINYSSGPSLTAFHKLCAIMSGDNLLKIELHLHNVTQSIKLYTTLTDSIYFAGTGEAFWLYEGKVLGKTDCNSKPKELEDLALKMND